MIVYNKQIPLLQSWRHCYVIDPRDWDQSSCATITYNDKCWTSFYPYNYLTIKDTSIMVIFFTSVVAFAARRCACFSTYWTNQSAVYFFLQTQESFLDVLHWADSNLMTSHNTSFRWSHNMWISADVTANNGNIYNSVITSHRGGNEVFT